MPPRGQEAPCSARAGQQRGLRERLGLQRGGRERGGGDQAGPGRLAAAGVEQVVGVGAVGASPDAAVEARRRDGAVGDAQRVRGAAQRDVVGAADADVAAAVDHVAARAASTPPSRPPAPSRCRRGRACRPGGRTIVAARTSTARQRVPGVAGRRGRRGAQGGVERGGRDADPRALVARGLDGVEQRGVGEPAGPARAEQRGLDRAAQQRRGGDLGPRVGVERAQLARGVEARQPRGDRLDAGAHAARAARPRSAAPSCPCRGSAARS